MKPDGGDLKCLTCGRLELPLNGHKGQPYWHPNGKYLVFTVQNTTYKVVGKGYSSHQPDAGRNHNFDKLYLLTFEGACGKLELR